MLKLLEILGLRRQELALMQVQHVLSAAQMHKPMLEVVTVKGRSGTSDKIRNIPVSSHDIKLLVEYIHVNRAPLIASLKRNKVIDRDSGSMLLNVSTGEGLRPNTILQEIKLLAKAADIPEVVCTHMFRHRFVTKLFVALIQQHNFDSEDSFRCTLISTEDFKRNVMEWTGHKSTSSLEPYIHLAFEELSGGGRVIEKVLLKTSLDSFKTSLEMIQLEAEEQPDPLFPIKRMKEITAAFLVDLNNDSD